MGKQRRHQQDGFRYVYKGEVDAEHVLIRQCAELHAALIEDPGVGRNGQVADAEAQLMPWQDEYDMRE